MLRLIPSKIRTKRLIRIKGLFFLKKKSSNYRVEYNNVIRQVVDHLSVKFYLEINNFIDIKLIMN